MDSERVEEIIAALQKIVDQYHCPKCCCSKKHRERSERSASGDKGHKHDLSKGKGHGGRHHKREKEDHVHLRGQQGDHGRSRHHCGHQPDKGNSNTLSASLRGEALFDLPISHWNSGGPRPFVRGVSSHRVPSHRVPSHPRRDEHNSQSVQETPHQGRGPEINLLDILKAAESRAHLVPQIPIDPQVRRMGVQGHHACR